MDVSPKPIRNAILFCIICIVCYLMQVIAKLGYILFPIPENQLPLNTPIAVEIDGALYSITILILYLILEYWYEKYDKPRKNVETN